MKKQRTLHPLQASFGPSLSTLPLLLLGGRRIADLRVATPRADPGALHGREREGSIDGNLR